MKNDRYVNYTLGGDQWLPRFIAGLSQKLCVQCQTCVKVCPAAVFVRTVKGTIEPRNRLKCIGCSVCELCCPESAITCSLFEDLQK